MLGGFGMFNVGRNNPRVEAALIETLELDTPSLPQLGTRRCRRCSPRPSSRWPPGAMVQMLGVFAEFERATIVERVIAGMERKAARGEWFGGTVPFGYRLDAEPRLLLPRPGCRSRSRSFTRRG